jgi:hypothetical protein
MSSSVCTHSEVGSAPRLPCLDHLPPPGPRWVLWLLWGFVLAWPAVSTVIMIFLLDVETDFQELYENGRRVIQTWRIDSVYQQAPASTFYPPGTIPEFLKIKPDRDWPPQDLPSGFYPPSGMPIYMLWSAMPPVLACFASCAVYGLLFFLAVRLLPWEAMRIHPRQAWHAWLFLALVVGGYITYDITTGQVSGIPIFALVVGYVCWRRGWIWRGAAALAVGIVFKLLPGAAVVFFLVKRQWKMVLATGLLTLAFGVLPGLVMFGPAKLVDGWKAYYANVAWPKSHPVEYQGRIRWTKPASFLNPSLSVTLLRWLSEYPRDYHTPFLPVAHFPQRAVYRGYQLLVLVMGVVSFWMCRRRVDAEPPEALATQYGLVLVWMVLTSPHLAVYYMAWALWPVAVLMGYVARRDLLEARPDRLNAWPIWAFAVSFPLSSVSVLRAIGMHPAMLLVLWAVLLANLLRGRFFERPAIEPAMS